ncbi:protein piccolo isoform X3 [Pelobates fuscus]|uniref:protein piccolo isoform X3 n=1 Tax=Pelobates fuscus TaxID=191477 RepID=UPI002FE46F0A
MGNEGSMEGGEGMGGYPDGMVGDGKGGFTKIPAGMEADLSQLSEEERKQIAAVMSRAQELPRGNQTDRPPLRIDANQSPRLPSKPPDPGPTGLSKSRTVDAFKTELKTPGRSPSTMSLREPRSKPDVKEEPKSSVMTGFLTDSKPLSVVSSVVNKFNPFDSKSDPGANQEETLRKQRVTDKEHEKNESLKGNAKPSHQVQQSPGYPQHPQGHARYQPTDATKPTPQQSAKSQQLQPDTKTLLEQGTSNIAKQPLNATEPLSNIPTPKYPLPHAKDPLKSVAQEPTRTTSSAQVQSPKKESMKQDRPATHVSVDKQNLQKSVPLKQTTHAPGGLKEKPLVSDPTKNVTKEPEKQPTQTQGTAKQSVQPAGSTKSPSQQAGITKKTPQPAANLKQQVQQTGVVKQGPVTQPTKQQVLSTTPIIQTAQKVDVSKLAETKPSSQFTGKPALPLAQPTKSTPQQQEKVPEPTSQSKKHHQDLPQDISKAAEKSLCPLCKSTELHLHSKEKANYNTCTQCRSTVCSLCGFNPNPHMTEINEWLCLNCQMQRALGMDMTSVPVTKPQPLKQKPASTLPPTKPPPETHTLSQRKESVKGSDQSLTQVSTISTTAITKQLPSTDSPAKSKKMVPDPQTEQVASKVDKPQPLLPEKTSQEAKPMVISHGISSSPVSQTKSDSLLSKGSTVHKDMDQKSTDNAKPIKEAQLGKEKGQHAYILQATHPTQELKQTPATISHPKLPPKPDSSQMKEDPKSSPTKVNPKVDGKQVSKTQQAQASPKPSPSHKPAVQQVPVSQAQPQPPKYQDQPRRFSLNLGSTAETPKPQPTTPQETVTGKLFGFGASIFSQASTFISTATQPGTQPQSTQAAAGAPPSSPKQPAPLQKSAEPLKSAKEVVHAPQSPKTQAMKKETKTLAGEKTDVSKSSILPKEEEPKKIQKKEADQESTDFKKTTKEPVLNKTETMPVLKKFCPLCKIELNIGSKDQSNFNTCTECKNNVCNMCGFNPTPHLTEVVEWLCLNCQTQRAMAGQLGDISKMPPPLGLQSKSSPKHPIPLEQQTQAYKVTTSPHKANKISNDQALKKDALKISDGKVDVSKENIYQEKFKQDSLPASLLAEVKKTVFPQDEEVSSIKESKHDFLSDMFESKERKTEIIPSEEKIWPKQDLTIDLTATVLKEVNERTYGEKKKAETSHPVENEAAKEKTEKEDDKSDTSSSQQQKSPQGLSDTGYSSDGISGSLGEIPSLIPSDEKDLHKEQTKCVSFSHENSPSSPSDLAKLESTVLSILEAQTNILTDDKSRKSSDLYGIYGGQTQDRVKTKILPMTPESFSSEEEELEDIQEEDEETIDENGKGASRKSHKGNVGSVRDKTARKRHDSLDDSSESENSPVPQRKRRTSNGSSSSDDYKHEDSQGSGDDEDFIRKQIIEMSADEDASGSEDEEFIRKKLKEISGTENKKIEAKAKPATVKCKRLTKKSSASYDDDGTRRHSWHHGDEEDEDEETYDESPEPKYRESKSQENEELAVSRGLRRFKTIELNSTISNTYADESAKQPTVLYYDEEPELEMESLTDSPEDRSREERSSSLHASSFTPGTSPTSVSSLDEDSDSSPSHKKMSGENKQQRKARHRSHGPVLPTIEDSSEEEELREEEELLKEQEKQRELEQQQRKSSSKKSKKDKDELRAQRRRERPKTPPSNLSPIEDASPTEELRQAAEMEELHRSSCSEYSPSIESEPEGFEISPEKIIEVQKVYKLPTSVSLYSPTDVSTVGMTENKNGQKKIKSAEAAYEEILCKAKLYQHEKERDDVFEKEPLYGGMLIEDYIYESLVEENFDESLDANILSSQDNVFEHKVRELKNTKDDICIDVVPNIENECFTAESFHSIVHQEDIVSSSYIVPESHEIIILESTDEKQPQESDTCLYDLIDCQTMQLTPGASPTQTHSEICLKTEFLPSVTMDISSSEIISSVPSLESSLQLSNAISIPDVKITQHFTAEEQEDDMATDYSSQNISNTAISESPDKSVSEECIVSPCDSFTDENASSEIININQPALKTSFTEGTHIDSSLPTDYKGNISKSVISFSQNDSLICATSTTAGPSTNQICFDPVSIIKSDAGKETTSVDHVIISVPDVSHSAEVARRTDLSFFTEEQSITGAIKTTDVITRVYIPETNTETHDFKNSAISIYSSNIAGSKPVECLFADKQSIMSAATVTNSITSAPKLPSVTSTVPSVTSKIKSLFRSSSSDSSVPLTTPTTTPPPPPPPPPLPPPTPPKPAVYSKKRPAPKIPLVGKSTGPSNGISQDVPLLKNNATTILKHHPPPPPVPPKPSNIPAGLVFSHRPTEGRITKHVLSEHLIAMQKKQEAQKITQPSTSIMTLNLIPSNEHKLPSPTSPLSPHSNKSSPRLTKLSMETYVVITLPSEPGTPTENVAAQTTTCWPLQAPAQEEVPHTMETISSTISYMQADRIQTSSDSYIASSLLSQIITADTTKATDSLSRSSVSDFSNIPTNLQTGRGITEKSNLKQIVKPSEFNNIIDLRTLSKIDYTSADTEMDNCMDLSSTPFDVKRHSQGSFSRPISAVQPAIVNLSSVSPVISSVSLAAETVTVVTCATTVSYTSSLENLVDLGSSMKAPLKLTTSKQHEEGSCGIPEEAEVPINLSLGTPTHSVIGATTTQGSFSPSNLTNGCTDVYTSQESVDSGVVDLSTTKSHRTMVTVDETTSEIITEIIEDDKPVDLTAGRRAVCCDVVYRLPFGRSCISQQSSTNLPEDRFGYRDDHYQYDRSGISGFRGVGGMKPSMSDTNLAEAGLFLYKSKNTFDYLTGVSEAAVDLTSGKMTTGEALDYQIKNTGAYPETRQVISGIGISAPQYSQARMTMSIVSPYSMGSVLRSSNGVVYSSVATPVPSPFAITTQPGSIFSTTVRDLSSFVTSGTDTVISSLSQSQPQPRPYSMLNTTTSDVNEAMTVAESGMQSFPVEVTATTSADLISILTSESESFSELTEDESTFVFPSEDGKQQQLNFQRELLELEKLKQQRLAEELEWERQEIQRFREQETIMVQKKLEELQSMKQHLLLQQEEERQAQYMMRQETLVQQQLHLEQIQQLQQQLHQQLEEQKLCQIYQYNYDPNETAPPQTSSDQVILETQFGAPEDGQFWTSDPHTTTAVSSAASGEAWYAVQSDGITQYISRPGILNSVSEMSLKEIDINDERQMKKRSSMPRLCGMYDELEGTIQEEPRSYKLIVDSGVQTDDEDGGENAFTGRRRRSKKGVDTSVQTDDEDQDEWDIPTRSRRRSRAGKYSEGNTDAEKARQFSKVSSIAVQTVAEMSVQTEPLGKIRTPSIRARDDVKIEIIKHISAPEKSIKGDSLGCQTEGESDNLSPQYLTDMSQKDKRRPTPLEIGYSAHLRAESSLQVAPSPPKSPKVLYSPISPVSPSSAIDSAFVPYEKTVDDISCRADINQAPPPSPKTTKVMQRSMSDPKPLSPTAEDPARTQFQYSDGYMTKTIQSGTQKKVKRTLPNPPPEEANNGIQSPYGTVGSVSRRRICRTTTMARAKILQDIDRELDLVERESSKLRKKQAELDEEEKEIDAKLRYLEMGINRRKEALLKEREKRERAYLQGVAEERDYMSDSEVNSTRPTRIESHLGLERPQTAPQTEYTPYLPPQTQSETQFVPPTSPYTQYQYQTPTLLTQAPTQYSQQSPYQQTLYHQVSSYQTQPTFQSVPTMSYTPQQQSAPIQQSSYQHQSQMLLLQQKTRQGALDLEPKIPSHYDVIRNQPLIITPASADSNYSVSHLGNKYSSLDLRLGLDEKSSMASSPMSSISAESFYADLEHQASRNYVLIDDIGELTKGSGSLSSAFGLHEKELSKADRILRSVDSRRTAEVTDFLAPISSSTRLHSYGKADEDAMEDPYELKLLKHQIKQEFRRGTETLDPLAGYSPYYHSDSLYRHFPKNEKYSISRLTLEKQAAKQLPPAILYQKQSKHKKALIDSKISKFSPIQESRDIEPDYSSYLSSSTSSIPSISSKVRLLQDDITYGLRKNITDQQKYLGPNLAQNLGATLTSTLRTSMQDEVDKPYVSGSRSRPSSRPSSIYGLDLSIKRELSSSSLRLKSNEPETLDSSFSHVAPSGRTKPSSLPISQSRGRIPIVAQNSEEESPLSPVGQPMGMARAAAGPLPPISADSRDQFGSSHSLPEVQQHMREESRTRGYDRDIAFIMDDFQHAMSDSEAYHLRREETDWFDKPREQRLENGHGIDRKLQDKLSHARSSHQQEQMNGKPIQYTFPHLRLKLQRDTKDHTVSGNGFGIRVVGGKEIPESYGEIGAYIAKILPGGSAEHSGKLTEGMQVLEWNGHQLTEKTYEEVHSIISQSTGEAEICVRLDINMLSNSVTPQNLELHEPAKPVDKTKSPGVDPKQLAAELQKVSQQQTPASAVEKGAYIHSGTTSAASSAVPSPGQPGSPSVSKKRHSSKSTEAIKTHSHPITGELQLQVNYDKHLGNLIIHILQARNLVPRDNNGYSDPFVKVYLLPGRGQVMVVQNASAEYKRRTKHVQKSLNPEWNQTVIYKNISMEQLKKKTLEVTVWDYDRFSSNDFLGEVLIDLSNPSSLDNVPRWYPLKEQSESIDHAKPHSSQSSQQVPKPSVIKSRSHGIFPDPSKDMQVPTIEKSHSSPGSSKSSSEGHLRSHGPSRSQSKTSVTQTHLEDAGAAIAAAEAAVQQLRLQPTAHKSGQSNHARNQHRHSIAGVLPIQRTQSDNLPPPANDSKDQSQLALKKVMSDGSVKTEARTTAHKSAESTVSTASSVSSFGSGYSMESNGSNTTGDNGLFPVPRIGKMNQNGQDLITQPGMTLVDGEGKTQVMGEIKIALKKEMKTDGEQLIVEILQCRNITYKFKSPDHLPDLYVKLYVINIATQKRIIKKKTRVCRHDREPSFNETFRFSMSPAGHSLQILLVSNGGKFMKKTLIGEAYIWLDKVDLRKRIVNWHKLLVSSAQAH